MLLLEDGIERVSGRVYGDESRHDSLRGGPDSGYGVSIWVGPLSALSYNRGLADEGGRAYQLDPPAFAAARLDAALEAPRRARAASSRLGATPGDAEVLASVDSPPMEPRPLTNKPSDNFFAELLAKDLAMQARGRGTTAAGAARRRLRAAGSGAGAAGGRLGPRARQPRLAYRVVRLLGAMANATSSTAFYASLPVAGVDGTLYDRACAPAPPGALRAKTGTLSNVGALSGYCTSRSGDVYAFSFLMNSVYPTGARRLQDRMAQAIAARRWQSAAGAAAERQLAHVVGQQGAEGLLVEDLDAQLLRLRVSLVPGSSPRHHVIGLLRHRPRDLAARRLDELGGLGAGEVRQRAGQHHGLAHQRALARGAGPPPLHLQPVLAQALDQRAGALLGQRLGTLAAMIGPIPSTAVSSSSDAASSASIERSWRARLRAFTKPMPAMPSAYSTRWKGCCLDASIASTRFAAEVSPKRSSSTRRSAVRS